MNKKYRFLDNHTWLFEQLKIKSMAQLATELAEEHGESKINLAGCIRFLVNRYFTKEQRDAMFKERKFHKNRKKAKTV